MDFITKLRKVEDVTQQKLDLQQYEHRLSKKGESSINEELECINKTTPTNKVSRFDDKRKKVDRLDYDEFVCGTYQGKTYTSICRTKKVLVETCGADEPDDLEVTNMRNGSESMLSQLNTDSEERKKLMKSLSYRKELYDDFYNNTPKLIHRSKIPRSSIVDYYKQKKNTGTTKKDMQMAKSVIDFPITTDLSEESVNADKEKDMSIVCQTLARDTYSQACSSSEEQLGCSGVLALKSTGTITAMNRDNQAAVIETKRNAIFSLTTDLTSEDGLEALSNQVKNTGFILIFFIKKELILFIFFIHFIYT